MSDNDQENNDSNQNTEEERLPSMEELMASEEFQTETAEAVVEERVPSMEELMASEEFQSDTATAVETPTQTQSKDGDINLDVLLQVPVALSIEVGRTHMPIGELLETGEGSVIELGRLVGEPLDVLVNGTLIAKGIVVLVNEKFGIQITDIISPEDRVKNLNSHQLHLS